MGEYGIAIDGEGIAALGDRLGDIADQLEEAAKRTTTMQSYGFPSSEGTWALDKVLGDQERARVELCVHLRQLRDLARDAGGCFISTERLVDARFRGAF